MAAFDEATLEKLDKKLIAAGYTDGEWRSIMFRYYGEDYEGMGERAKLRATERENRRAVLDVSKEINDMGPHGASELDLAVPGGTQSLLERNMPEYFPVKPLPDEQRKLRFTIASPSMPLGQTIGSFAPGKDGVASQGLLSLEKSIKDEDSLPEGEASKDVEDAEEEDEEGEDGQTAPAAQKGDVDDDELMFIWNRRQAPQHRREQVSKELTDRLNKTREVEDYLRAQYAVAKRQDADLLATAGVSAKHPFGTLAGGQISSFVSDVDGKATNTVWEGQKQTARWALEANGEQQPEERVGLLPIGPSRLELDAKLMIDNKLVQTQADARRAQEAMLRDSLGASRLEMPPDQDPHYMTPTLFKAAHSLDAATPFARPPATSLTEQTQTTATALQGLQAEARERVSKVQERLKSKMIKDVAEKIDVPALLLRKFNYLRNPRYTGPPIPFREQLTTVNSGASPSENMAESKNDFIVASPAAIVFSKYSVGELYEAPLKLLNTSHTLRRVRVLPPASPNFSVTLMQYLSEDGLVAPGLYSQCYVRFRPDTLADCSDTLWVVTEGGLVGVPLIARREPPNLTLPDTVDVGNCFVDDRRTVSIACKNQGGEGRFLVIADSEWPDAPDDVHTRHEVLIPPFRIRPGSFALAPGGALDLEVDFCPSQPGHTTAGFRLVCDNCSVHRYVLSGMAFLPGVRVTRLDAEEISGPLASMLQPQIRLNFSPVAPQASGGKAVVLQNDTPLPMAFHWEVEHIDTPHTRMQAYRSRWGRVGETHSVFGVTQEKGTLFPKASVSFQVSFQPRDVVAYHAIARMYVHDMPRSGAGQGGFGSGGSGYHNVLMCEVKLWGAGGECVVLVDPPVVFMSQRLSVGKTYTRSVSVTNQSQGPAEISWETYPEILYQAVRVVPAKVSLKPREKRELKVEVTPKMVGALEVSLGCEVLHGAAMGLSLFAEVDGPQLKINEAHIDFGLMRVGEEIKRKLTITNVCDVYARWSLEIQEENDCQGLQSAISMSPSKGTLDASRTVTVEITFRPTQPLRARACVVLNTEGGQSLYTSLRAEVLYPCVHVSDLSIDLGTIFLAVPVTRRVYIRNATLLPNTRYSWAAAQIIQKGPLAKRGSPVIDITFRLVEGLLGPNESIPVDFTVQAVTLGDGDEDDTRPGELGSASRPGIMEALVPLDVDGMPQATGFELHAKVMGLAVTYHVGTLKTVPPVPDSIRGTPEALKVGVRTNWPADLLGPDTQAPCVIDFGTIKALCKQSRTLLIRNHTGIASVFTLHLEKFGVASHEILLAEAIKNVPVSHTPPSTGSRRHSVTSRGGSRSPPKSPLAGASRGTSRQSLAITQSGVSIGSVPVRKVPKVSKQTGTIATVRMGAVLSRAVATGAAARSITEAETQMRELRASASWVSGGHKLLKEGLRPGHAASRLQDAEGLGKERKRLKSSALWCLPGDHSSIATRGHTSQGGPKTRLILSDDHEDTERFRGAAGQELLNKRAQAEEAQIMLEQGRGVALTASCYEGDLPAWGEVEVRIDVYSDMAGIFRDRLEVHVLGLQPVIIPVVGKIIGTPVALEGGTLGIHKADLDMPRLDMGDVLLGATAITRSVRVANAGPWPATVSFRLLEGRGTDGKAITLVSSVGGDGRVSYIVEAVDPPEAEQTPFSIDPAILEVPPHSTKTLTVSCAWDRPEHHCNILEGVVECSTPLEHRTISEQDLATSDEALDPDNAHIGLLRAYPTAHRPLALPALRVQLECNVQGAWLETDCHKQLRWMVSSSRDPKDHTSFVKCLNLSNRSRANLSFCLKVNPPFSIENTICTAPLHPMVKPVSKEVMLSNPPPQMFTLPPNDNVQVHLRFTPPAKHRSGRIVDDALIFGELLVTFANEEEQKVRLQAHMLHPQVDASPTELDFQSLHVESIAALTVSLTNPTLCDAHWTVQHQPKTLASALSRSMGTISTTGGATQAGGAPPQTAGGAEGQTGRVELVGTDDPTVFTFDPPGGIIKGTGNRPTIPSTAVLTVRFAPKEETVYMSKFKISVEGGRCAFIILRGQGSYDESMEPGGSTGVIRDHPGYHPLLTGVRGPVVPNEAVYGADIGTIMHPPPQSLPSWYDMDKAMPPHHITSYRRE